MVESEVPGDDPWTREWRPYRPRIAPVAPPPLPSPTLELVTSLVGDLPAQDDVAGWGERARGIESMQRFFSAMALRTAVGVTTAVRLSEEAALVPPDARVESLAASCLAAEIQCSETAAEGRIDEAAAIVDGLPSTFAHLQSGQISLAAARIVAELTVNLSDEQRSAVEDRVWPAQVGRTGPQVRRAVRRIIARLDPAALAEQSVVAREDRRVEISGEGIGTVISVTGEHAVQHELWSDLRFLAGPQRADDPRTLDQRTYDALVAAVHSTAEAARAGGSISPRWAARCAVQVTLTAETLLGRSDRPATLMTVGAGEQVIPGSEGRRLALESISLGEAVDRLVLSARTGVVTEVVRVGSGGKAPPGRGRDPGSRGYRATERLLRLLDARDPLCIEPLCNRPARSCDHDHHDPHHRGGPTAGVNMGPACRRHHRTKQHPLVTMRVVHTEDGTPIRVWGYPTGSVVPSRPPDQR